MDNSKQTAPQIDIENIIGAKNPRLLKIIPGFIIKKLKKILHQNDINHFISENYNVSPYQFVDNGLTMFGANIKVLGTQNLPANGRALFVSNHPLGGLDGLVFIQTVSKIYGQVRFPVNDLLLNLPSLREIFVPINKHGSISRQAFVSIDNAYKSDMPVLYFPAGLCSRKIKGKIIDLEWKKNFLIQAIKHERDIIPVHINGSNSNFFYNLSNFRKALGIKVNIEMLFLVHEMYSQYNKDITISFGKPIPYTTFDNTKNTTQWVEFIRRKTYQME